MSKLPRWIHMARIASMKVGGCIYMQAVSYEEAALFKKHVAGMRQGLKQVDVAVQASIVISYAENEPPQWLLRIRRVS